MTYKLSKYGYLRIGTCSPEIRVADADFNAGKIVEAIDHGSSLGCKVMLFPELSISAYTCGDLFYQRSLLKDCSNALVKIADHTAKTGSIAIVGLPVENRGRIFNAAAVASNGNISGIIPKTYLCNTNQYYEERWFSSELDRVEDHLLINGEKIPFGADLLFEVQNIEGCTFGIEICEDLWTVIPPSLSMAAAGATVMFNLSASDEFIGKRVYRSDLVKSQSARGLGAYVLSSCGPGESTTDLVFGGHCAIAENGHLLEETERFQFDTQVVYADIDIERMIIERTLNNSFAFTRPLRDYRQIGIDFEETNVKELKRKFRKSPFVPEDKSERDDFCREIFAIQTTALAKRLKHINAKHSIIGISGGLDSTLALIVTARTYENLGYDMKDIIAVSMPGFGTTKRTKGNAEKLAEKLGVTFKTIPIEKSVARHFKDIGHDPEKHDTVFENAQARERTQILMDLANKYVGIVIGTGDLSEIALGWSTYNGDHMSMYGVNAGVPKTLVRYVVNWSAETQYPGEISKILKDIIATPISPELLPISELGELLQETEQKIGPYELHDFFLYHSIRCHFSPSKVVFLAEQAFGDKYSREEITAWIKIFYKRFFTQQFKRSCMPDGIKVGTVSLSPRGNWRMPSDALADGWLKELESL